MSIGTGHFATLEINSVKVDNVRMIEGHRETSPQVDVTTLETTDTRAYIPADLGELSSFVVECVYDNTTAPLARNNRQQTVLTFQQRSGETAGATLTEDAWITDVEFPSHETNVAQMVRYTFQWAGSPTFAGPTLGP